DGIRDGHVTGVQTCALPIFDADSELLQPFLGAADPGDGKSVVELVGEDPSDDRSLRDVFGRRPDGGRNLRELSPGGRAALDRGRSEERRVGKEGRVWWSRGE